MTDELDTFYNDVADQTGMDVMVYSPWSPVSLHPACALNLFVVEAATTHRDYGAWHATDWVSMGLATDVPMRAGLMVGRRLRETYTTQVAQKREATAGD